MQVAGCQLKTATYDASLSTPFAALPLNLTCAYLLRPATDNLQLLLIEQRADAGLHMNALNRPAQKPGDG
jgi:hypothetical protein